MSAPAQRLGPGRSRNSPPRQQRGIAMLVAILLVALGTIIAASVAYESAMSARRESSNLAFDEALLVGEGAEALAAFGLQQVFQNAKPSSGGGGSPDVYPGQQWAMAVGPLEVVPGVTLEEAQLEDLQGRFNLNWLVDISAQAGTPNLNQPLAGGATNQVQQGTGQQPSMTTNAAAIAAFKRLLTLAKVDPQLTDKIIDWIDSDHNPQPDGMEDSGYLGQNPPFLTANQYITSTTELLAIPGFGRENYEKLRPYITALPPEQNMKINICSAPGIVLDALKGTSIDFSSDEDALAKNRAAAPGCFPTQKDYLAATDSNLQGVVGQLIGTTSQYFRLTSLITIGSTEFNLYSLLRVEQQGYYVHPIQRSFTPD